MALPQWSSTGEAQKDGGGRDTPAGAGRSAGTCGGVTCGPLIKSGRRPMIRTARCCEGFPVYLFEIMGLNAFY
jgi:hypothetical protein